MGAPGMGSAERGASAIPGLPGIRILPGIPVPGVRTLPRGDRRLAACGLCLAALSLIFMGQGGWIIVKAQLAQVLLAKAWAETRAGATEARPWPWADTWPVARLEVPALGVDEIVLSGADGRTLAFAPGHLAGSALPGVPGNTVLAGHRDTHFRFLRELAPGDEIHLESPDGAVHAYRVVSTEVLDHRDARVLSPTVERTLTLITCYPFDAVAPGGPLRYVVRAMGVPSPNG